MFKTLFYCRAMGRISFRITSTENEHTEYNGDIPVDGFCTCLEIRFDDGVGGEATISSDASSKELFDLSNELSRMAAELRLFENKVEEARRSKEDM